MCNLYGLKAVSVRAAQNWFKRFQSGNFDVKNEPRSGQPLTDKVEAILKKVKEDRHISSNITKELEIDHKTVLIRLKKSWILQKISTLEVHTAHRKKSNESCTHWRLTIET
ncbi:Putative uncharacterized protein FLJ37770 [Eumeta japonica]|uniref:Mos1 transposase HTH domain-containing protein n=1 Tax=Eumeta variegata TaxID=151549 RepID=A0A4C1UBN5_EUMVA|nr:Putative uncharacterized protein FLJ37770 [Eumeta japonica]